MLKPYIRLPRAAGISYTPAQLAAAYKFPTGLGGHDKPIGIIELGGGYHPADITAAFKSWGLPAPTLHDVSVQGGKNTPGDDADLEVVLDIQISAAIFSYCTDRAAIVRVYFAPNTDAGFEAAVAQAAADGCATVSISWGQAEDGWGRASCQTFDAICSKALAAGTIIFAASGDNLSADGETGAHVDFPASSPSVVGCGGTTKTASSETVWNSGGGGTGGGYSAYFPNQTWQIGAASNQGRMVPDVAGNADPATGYKVYINGGWTVVGGTSAVAPLYAGLFCALTSAANKFLGNVLPKLFQNPAAFTDITVGNNGQWRAAAGVDPCTGLGVPIGTTLNKIFTGGTVTPPPPPTTWKKVITITGTGDQPVITVV